MAVKKIYKQVNSDERGVVLLVSLIILALVLFSVLGLSLILLNEIRSARYLDNAVISYYSAESGAERSLFLLKESRGLDEAANSALLFDDLEPPELRGLQHKVDASDEERLYAYTTISTSSPAFSAANIIPNHSVQFDIFDPEQEDIVGVLNTGIDQLNVDWQLNTCNSSHELEITLVGFDITDSGLDIDSSSPIKEYRQCGCTGNGACLTASVGLDPDKFYHVSLRPLDSTISTLSAYAQDNDTIPETVVGIPSQVNIQVQGIYRDSVQNITIQTPWDESLLGLFDYVIFTEADLIKSVLAANVQPFQSQCGTCSADSNLPCSSSADCVAVGGDCNTAFADPFCPLDLTGGETSIPVNQTDGGACNALCTGYTYCGDGVTQVANGAGTEGASGTGDEECDDGNSNNSDACTNQCVKTICGDLAVQKPNSNGLQEDCDDGNSSNTDQCNACKFTYCGDFITQSPNGEGFNEVCDQGTGGKFAICGSPGACKCDCSGYVPPPF